jgi:hypothetical protein
MQAIYLLIFSLIVLFSTLRTGGVINNNEAAGRNFQDPVTYVPGRYITDGPYFHWFGYYDKLQFDPTGRYVLAMQTDFENRSPHADDEIRIGIIDLQNNDEWIELGTSRAWNWQQGCMLQFMPGSPSEIVWNDRDGDTYISHILDIHSRQQRTLPFPVYTLSPDGKMALSVDFERINDLRPGYGYAGIPDPNGKVLAPDDAGIYSCDLESGTKKLIISLAQMQQQEIPGNDPSFADRSQMMNWFNHLLYNTDGSRFVFLHRWKSAAKRSVGGFGTLMYSASPDGSDIRLVDGSGYTSHFIWKNPAQLLIWTRHPSHEFAFYLFNDDGKQDPEVVGKGIMTVNGHCTYLPDQNWILNDTYPDPDRLQKVFLYHTGNNKRMPLGDFYLPPEYKGEWRIDTHPRSSPDGSTIVIDYCEKTSGRQLYLLDISGIY